MHREKSGFTLVELLVMIENTYEFFPWTSKGNYAVCWGNDGYLDFDPFQPLSQEIKQKRGAFHIVMLPGWKDAPQEDLRQENLGPWKLGHGLGTKLGSLLDGSSNTLMVGEVIGFDSPEDARGARVFPAMGSAVFSAKFPPDAAQTDVIAMCEEAIPTSDRLRCTKNRPSVGVYAELSSGRSQCVEV